MSYELEYSLALAIDNEQASGTSQEAVLNNGNIALVNIRQRFDVSNFEIPRATRLLERLFTLAILREQAAGNIDIPSRITRLTNTWERIAARLGRNETPFPSNGNGNSNDNADTNVNSDTDTSGNSNDNTNDNDAHESQFSMTESTGSGAAIAQAVAVLAPPAMPAVALNATAPARRRYDRKRGKDRYGCELCDQPRHYTSKCSLDRHKKKHHGVPTPGDLRKERKLTAEAVLGARADGYQADEYQTAGDRDADDGTVNEETGDEMDLE
ncbi:hypothetical protein BDP81DRAFT_398311 [Colletotrichum phormii]|uniref:Uncharacterized protein n=1 Tax=Colletotrichum phormii TaxID=359342 RepID=A0AAJ0EAJ3_9PEZI|nr:uncharacterized protein BDP81DRAFT_398311 [Colletotrichum phormii]KAK1624676.1 hypothetical protein BDP81DRAFT_398311 [Colletotrichum phormii]